MSGHTQGPWEVVQGDEWTTDVGTPEGEYEDGRKRHWNVASVNRRRGEWKENRRLIAAAPELLAALQSFVAAVEDDGEPMPGARWHAEYVAARAAIAKATQS